MFLFLQTLARVPETLARDGGPIYRETDISHIIAEPWNGISSLAFLVPVFYWLWKLRGRYRQHSFLIACMPLLVLGGLGSAAFHAFRISYYLLLLDFLPIIVLTLAVSIYFWYRVLKSGWEVADLVIVSFVIRLPLFESLSRNQAINGSYFITGCMMFIPALIILYRTKFARANHLVSAVVIFLLALLFRYLDRFPVSFLPMGTHWLWHVLCGIGIMPLSYYLVKIVDPGIQAIADEPAD